MTEITAEHEQAALGWLSRINEQPQLAERAEFKRWLLANPAHARAYAQAQALWRLSEAPASLLAAEEDQALQGYLRAMQQPAPGAPGAVLPAALQPPAWCWRWERRQAGIRGTGWTTCRRITLQPRGRLRRWCWPTIRT